MADLKQNSKQAVSTFVSSLRSPDQLITRRPSFRPRLFRRLNNATPNRLELGSREPVLDDGTQWSLNGTDCIHQSPLPAPSYPGARLSHPWAVDDGSFRWMRTVRTGCHARLLRATRRSTRETCSRGKIGIWICIAALATRLTSLARLIDFR